MCQQKHLQYIFVITLILCSILPFPVEALTDDPLQKYKWKRKITSTYQKQWLKYQEALIFLFFSSASQEKTLLPHMIYFLCQLNQLSNIPDKQVTPITANGLWCVFAPEGSPCISPKFTTYLTFWISIHLGTTLVITL